MIGDLLATPFPEPCQNGNDPVTVGATISSVMVFLLGSIAVNIVWNAGKKCYNNWAAKREEARIIREQEAQSLQTELSTLANELSQDPNAPQLNTYEEQEALLFSYQTAGYRAHR